LGAAGYCTVTYTYPVPGTGAPLFHDVMFFD
jgi:hypothetical protein